MRIPLGPCQTQLVIQRSRFLGILTPVADVEAARAEIKALKNAYPEASHVVHAFSVGPERAQILGCSDDGEPAGTAGRPILEVIKGCGGSNFCLAVVRWFGGTKLGTGGLARAYSETAQAVLALCSWQEARDRRRGSVLVPYALHRGLKALLDTAQAEVITEGFGDQVEVTAWIPLEHWEALDRATLDLTRGQATWLSLDRP